jgi:hypothetical protein
VERITEEWAINRSESEYTIERAKQQRVLLELCDLGEDGDENATSSDTLECVTKDEDVHGGCNATDQRPDFE